MKILPYRLWLYFLAIFYVSWTTYKLWTDAADRNPFFVSGTLVFFVLYVIPFTVFQAKVESKPDGLHVLQYRSVVIPYSDVKRCMGLFLVPFQVTIVVTKRRFPLNLLVTGDHFKGIPKWLIQDGELAKPIKSMMAAGPSPTL